MDFVLESQPNEELDGINLILPGKQYELKRNSLVPAAIPRDSEIGQIEAKCCFRGTRSPFFIFSRRFA